MSDVEMISRADKVLEHHGVKGMHWGQRRAAKKLAKADKKWEQNLGTTKAFIQVHNRAAELANKLDVDRINNKPEYKGKPLLNKPNDPLTKKYMKEHEDAFNKRMQQAADEIVGPNPSGTKRLKFNSDGTTSYVDIKHDANLPNVKLKIDKDGRIVGYILEANEMAQTDLVALGDEILEHYGVKGMRWGKVGGGKSSVSAAGARTNSSGNSQNGSSGSQLVTQTKRSSVKLGVGKKPPPVGSRTHDPKKLNNRDLKKVVARMRLEQEFASLNKKVTSDGKKKAADILKTTGKVVTTAAGVIKTSQQVAKVLNNADFINKVVPNISKVLI